LRSSEKEIRGHVAEQIDGPEGESASAAHGSVEPRGEETTHPAAARGNLVGKGRKKGIKRRIRQSRETETSVGVADREKTHVELTAIDLLKRNFGLRSSRGKGK